MDRREKQGENATFVLSADRNIGPATPIMGLDCEYVGIGPRGSIDTLARVSIVNEHGKVVYDEYVKPSQQVTDYRTSVSGIRPHHLQLADTFEKVMAKVRELCYDKIIVGCGLQNDFKVMKWDYPESLQRNIQQFNCLQVAVNCGRPSLKHLARDLLGITIQEGEHDSVIDARAALRVYQVYEKKIEDERSSGKHYANYRSHPSYRGLPDDWDDFSLDDRDDSSLDDRDDWDDFLLDDRDDWDDFYPDDY